jgi:uncharacterized protein YceK
VKQLASATILVLALAGCATVRTQLEDPLGSARAVHDFHAYRVQRVGIFAPRGSDVDAETALAFRDALADAFAASTPYEIVPLGEVDLEAVARLDSVRTGRTRPEPLLDIARRASIDALLVPRVVDYRPYEPVRIGMEVDLVAAETGLAIWTGRVRVDTGDAQTLEALEAWQVLTRSGGASEHAVDVLSPRRLGEFVAAELARLL